MTTMHTWVSGLVPGLALTAPLLVFSSAWSFQKLQIGRRRVFPSEAAAWLSLACFFMACGISVWTALFGSGAAVYSIGSLIYLDPISSAMGVLVALIGAIVMRYSSGYMDGDPNQPRFMKWLSLTLASVQFLVVTGNLMGFFAAWLSTSLCLHQLLVYYPNRPGAVLAARKKFIISRLGDVCLLAAIGLVWWNFQTLEFSKLLKMASTDLTAQGAAGNAIALLLVCGAFLKSAQFPFHSWLPETMETPTPVSALMHAGIINAGGYLIIRLSPLIAPFQSALVVLAVVGTVTACLGSWVMLTQTSIKKKLAYSTIAQMGFMLLQCGLGAFSLAFLHIIAHALYKAHAFLSSGSVVELSKAGLKQTRTGPKNPILLVCMPAILIGLSAALHLSGLDWRFDMGHYVLAMVWGLGLTQLLLSNAASPFGLHAATQLLGVSLGLALSYFILHQTALLVFGNTVSRPGEMQNGMLWMSLGVLSVFCLSAILQSRLPHGKGAFWCALHVHAANGFYFGDLVKAMINRLESHRNR